MRKVHHAEHDCRPRGHLVGRNAHRRRAGKRKGTQGPRYRDGVPVLRALPAHDRPAEHRLPVDLGEGEEGRNRVQGRRNRENSRSHRVAGPQARPVVGRSASACRDGSRDRARPQGVPDGRAAVQSGRQATRADAFGDRSPAEPIGHHHGLRDTRPDRSDDAWRSRRRAPRRGRRSRSAHPRSCTPGRPISSSPVSSDRPR